MKKSLLRASAAVLILLLVGVGYIGWRETIQAPSASLPEIQEMASLPAKYSSYEKYFVLLAERKGALYAYEVLRNSSLPPGVHLHALGHVIGYKLYEQEGITALQHCTNEFQYACSHAVLTQAFVDGGFGIFKEVGNICGTVPGGISAYTTCFHGVGHGIMAFLEYDYKEAVTQCKALYDSLAGSDPRVSQDRVWGECVGGATMELLKGEHDPDAREAMQSIYAPDSDIYMPCNASFLDDDVRYACYAYLTGRFLKATEATPGIPSPEAYREAVKYCDAIPVTDTWSREGCYGGFGADFIYFASKDDYNFGYMREEELAQVHEWCGYISDFKGEEACLMSSLNTIFWEGRSGSEAPLLFCELTENLELQNTCYLSLLSQANRLYEPAAFLELCMQFPEPYHKYCKNSSE